MKQAIMIIPMLILLASLVNADAAHKPDGFSVPASYTVVRTSDIPDPPPGKVALRLSLAYMPRPLPGTGLDFYEPDPEVSSLWAMQSLPKAEVLPVGKIIEDGVLFLEPGEKRNITVAFRNPTSSEVSFMTQPYDVSPANGLPKTRLTCFCMSMVYKAPAEGSWYRVLGVGVADDASPGSKMDAMFTILTNPEWFAMKAHGAEATKTSMQQAQKTPASPLIESGKLVAARNGCQSCHSPDGMSSPGPTWEHLFGAMRKFVDGAPVRCDREYLRESILNPNAKIVEGYPPGMMPGNYSQKLSDEELHALIEYIISLAN